MIQHKVFEHALYWESGDMSIQWDTSNSCTWVTQSLAEEKIRSGEHIGVDHVDRPLAITNGYVIHAVKQIARRFKQLGVPFDPDMTTRGPNGMVKVNLEIDNNHPNMDEIKALHEGCKEVSNMNKLMMLQKDQAARCLDAHAFDFGSITDLPALDGMTRGCVTLPYGLTYMELRNPHKNVICCSAEYINDNSDSWNRINEMGLNADHEFGSSPILFMFWVHFPGKVSTFYREFSVVGWKKDGDGPEVMIVSTASQDSKRNQHVSEFSLLGRNVINMTNYMLHCLEVLNANGMETVEVPEPTKLNKKRAKSGKVKISGFHTLKIYNVSNRQVTGQRKPTGESGDKKTAHWRRAHLRTYKHDRYVRMKGQTRLIEARWIGGGDKSAGPDKDYKIL